MSRQGILTRFEHYVMLYMSVDLASLRVEDAYLATI